MKIILLILLSTSLFAQMQEVIHSSISTYYETKNYTNSKQKTDASVYAIGADIHSNDTEYKFLYEDAKATTKKPPLPEDLQTQKLFLRYIYTFDNVAVNLNYINILHDNLAITNHGQGYGLGFGYKVKKLQGNLTQFYTHYDDFNVYQSDLKLDYKIKVNDVKLKLSSITKYIAIDEKNINSLTKNAQDSYLTSGVKVGAKYKNYTAGAGAYFGKRTFAIMNEGFKVQHHAMEFDRTYAIGLGIDISGLVLRAQYVYQRAEELAQANENVEVDVLRLVINYKF